MLKAHLKIQLHLPGKGVGGFLPQGRWGCAAPAPPQKPFIHPALTHWRRRRCSWLQAAGSFLGLRRSLAAPSSDMAKARSWGPASSHSPASQLPLSRGRAGEGTCRFLVLFFLLLLPRLACSQGRDFGRTGSSLKAAREWWALWESRDWLGGSAALLRRNLPFPTPAVVVSRAELHKGCRTCSTLKVYAPKLSFPYCLYSWNFLYL